MGACRNQLQLYCHYNQCRKIPVVLKQLKLTRKAPGLQHKQSKSYLRKQFSANARSLFVFCPASASLSCQLPWCYLEPLQSLEASQWSSAYSPRACCNRRQTQSYFSACVATCSGKTKCSLWDSRKILWEHTCDSCRYKTCRTGGSPGLLQVQLRLKKGGRKHYLQYKLFLFEMQKLILMIMESTATQSWDFIYLLWPILVSMGWPHHS